MRQVTFAQARRLSHAVDARHRRRRCCVSALQMRGSALLEVLLDGAHYPTRSWACYPARPLRCRCVPTCVNFPRSGHSHVGPLVFLRELLLVNADPTTSISSAGWRRTLLQRR